MVNFAAEFLFLQVSKSWHNCSVVLKPCPDGQGSFCNVAHLIKPSHMLTLATVAFPVS